MQIGQTAEPAAKGSNATFVVQTAGELRADGWFYAVVAVYLAGGWLLALYLDATPLFKPILYVEPWLNRLSYLTLLAVLVLMVWHNPKAPLTGLPSTLRTIFGMRMMAGLVMIVAVAVFYGVFTSIKNMLPIIQPFGWDVWLADLDRALHGGVDPGPFLFGFMGAGTTAALDFIYGVLWFFVFKGVMLWAAFSTVHAHLRPRFFITFALCWIVIGNVLAGLFLSAGPCFYGYVTGDYERFGELAASVAGSAATYQPYLWKIHTSGDVSLGSGISAFPSMHLAMATLAALFLWSVSRRLGVLGFLFVAIIQIGSVRLAWHYAVDGYASILLTLLFWQAAGWICRSVEGQRGVACLLPIPQEKGCSARL